jgi:hypothetical protein
MRIASAPSVSAESGSAASMPPMVILYLLAANGVSGIHLVTGARTGSPRLLCRHPGRLNEFWSWYIDDGISYFAKCA